MASQALDTLTSTTATLNLRPPRMLKTISPQPSTNATSVLVVADGKCAEIRALLAECQYPVLWLTDKDDTLLAISRQLELCRQLGQPIHSLHWVSHASPGVLEIGRSKISPDDLTRNKSTLARWDINELSFWGCRYASDALAVRLWEKFTGASVFATAEPLGQLDNGKSNWQLRTSSAAIQANIPFDATTAKAWPHQLSTSEPHFSDIPANSFLSVEFDKFRVKPISEGKKGRWDYKLVVSGQEQNSIWFQDRPLRNYGHFEFDSITGKKAWTNLFQDENPNSILTGNGRSFVFENGSFKPRKNGRYVAHIKSLGSDQDIITGDWTDSSLLIDSSAGLATGTVVALGSLFAISAGLYLYRNYVKAQLAMQLEREFMTSFIQAMQNAVNEGTMEFLDRAGIQSLTLSTKYDPDEEFLNAYADQLEEHFLSGIDDIGLTEDELATVKTTFQDIQSSLIDKIGNNFDDISRIYATEFQVDEDTLLEGQEQFLWDSFSSALSEAGYATEMEQVSTYIQSDAFKSAQGSTILDDASNGVFETDSTLDAINDFAVLSEGVDSASDTTALIAGDLGGDSLLLEFGETLLFLAAL